MDVSDPPPFLRHHFTILSRWIQNLEKLGNVFNYNKNNNINLKSEKTNLVFLLH